MDEDDTILLPCGDSVRARDVVGDHLGGERLVTCAVHNRKFVIKVNVRRIVEYEIRKEL